jgi:hypothetical protein
MTIAISDMPVMGGRGAQPIPEAEPWVGSDAPGGAPPTSLRRSRLRRAGVACAVVLSTAGWLARLEAPPTGPAAKITPAEWNAISQGQSAIAQAEAYLRSDLATVGQLPPDYGPSCSPYGCVANLP